MSEAPAVSEEISGTDQTTVEQPPIKLRDLTSHQWKSGIAAWLGWLFDGLDMHLYVLVATPFVAELIHATRTNDPAVGYYGSWIQAAFLFGWALGGGFFGRIADRLGRSRTLTLTILTYALFTGLSYFAQTWWQLLIFRFLAALGIGGEWAVGASLISETWPKTWRPWLAAVLQTGVNLGIMLAGVANFMLADYPKRSLFLVGILPALLVLWIRRAVPEPEEWHAAQRNSTGPRPQFMDLFRGEVRRISLLTLTVCTLALTGHWAFMYWHLQQLHNLLTDSGWESARLSQYKSQMVWVVMLSSIAGNFLAGWLAKQFGYRKTIVLFCVVYFLATFTTYSIPRGPEELWYGFAAIGMCHGVFALFTMYLPPLFPTLLRTSGAGFCYNFGRIVAGIGTVAFGLLTKVGDYRLALLYAGFLFVPAAVVACFLPEPAE